ncbi:MAG: hypothetical protein IJW18_05025 [Lachnospiraceae bacterium]|nr:hypothetical protein [Lachnospiraceae bacterium]
MVEIICNNYLLYVLMGLFILGVLSRLSLVLIFGNIKNDTYNKGTPHNRLLKQIKLKAESYGQLDISITNMQTFVKRSMCEYRVGGLGLYFLEKMLGQMIFYIVVVGGLSVWHAYAADLDRGIITLYAMSTVLFVVLLYNVSKVADAKYLRENTELYVMDYLDKLLRGHELVECEEAETMTAVDGIDNIVAFATTHASDRSSLPGRMETAKGLSTEKDGRKPEDIISEEIIRNLQMSDGQENKIIEEVLSELFC